MKVLEVNSLQAGIGIVEKDLHLQKQQLHQIENNIQAFVDLRDSFKGAGGQAIRQFYESYHLSFLKQLLAFYEEYTETLTQIKRNLQAFEPDSNGFIKESFLEDEVAVGLRNIKNKTILLTEEANDIMSGVSDIVSLPRLDEFQVLQNIANAERKRDVTVGQLHTFDLQQTTTLQALEHTLIAMVRYVQLGFTLFQSKSGFVQTVESIFLMKGSYGRPLSLFAYSAATFKQLSTWDNFYLNYLLKNPATKVDSLISTREAEAQMRHAKDSVEVIDEYSGMNEVSVISGRYYTLGDGKILRQYYDVTGAFRYEYVKSIPKDQTGEAKETGLEVLSFILDFTPILSNIKATIEASSGKDFITGREIGDVERAIIGAAILGGPIVKGAFKIGKAAMKQLPKVKNVLNPDKVKSVANDFYDSYIRKGVEKGYSAFNDLVRKVADMPMPFSPDLAPAYGMSFSNTIGESMKQAKESIIKMTGEVKERVAGKTVHKSVTELIKESTCSNEELGKYLLKNAGPEAAENFAKNGSWPEGLQIPKDSSVLKTDGSIDWSKAAEGGYVIKDGKAVKESFTPQVGEVIDRYGKPDGRYTSPIIDNKAFGYSERSLPYVEDLSSYRKYEVVGDFSKLKEYVDNSPDAKLKAEIEATVTKYYDEDYSKLVSYKGEAAAVEGWGSGGAIQYELSLSVEQLEKLGLLKEIR